MEVRIKNEKMETKSKIERGFITIPLSQQMHSVLDKISFAKKRVPKGKHTDTHMHRFFSAYLVKNMEALLTDNGEIKMPEYALVIVLPKVNHTWSNRGGRTENCYVSDLSPAHGEHIIYG